MLSVETLNTFRGPAQVLRDVSLSIGDGEAVCLVGRNGAGKSTTIESIMGLLPISSGTIRLHDEDITGLPPHERARRGLGYAPEDTGIFPELTVAENLMISRWQSEKREPGKGEEIENRIYSLFPEIRDLLGRDGINLSGGQKKMVAIARAMALSPTLLLLDEAFEGLAPVVVARFRDAVLRIKEMGFSLLVAESHLGAATGIADRLYVIDRGEIVFEGTTEEALADEAVIKALRG